MSNTASLKKEYAERIAPALKSQFQYSSTMQIPVLKKIVINQGLGMAVADKKIIEVAICFKAALFSAYLATNLARFISRAFIDSFAIIYQSFLAFLNGKPNSFNKA